MLPGFSFLKKPRIHDITTDVDNPPELNAAQHARGRWQNPVEYEGRSVSSLQQQAYPDIGPIISRLTLQQTWTRAKDIAGDLGWHILAEDLASGRIEAVDITRFFRFRDDVVIRIRQQDNEIRLDLRSASRLGKNDFGTNAKRIRDFVRRFNAEL